MTTELCSQCLKPIRLGTESYYTGFIKSTKKRYYLHPVCYQEWGDKK